MLCNLCWKILKLFWCEIPAEVQRIFTGNVQTQRGEGARTYHLAKFGRKLHENFLKKWIEGSDLFKSLMCRSATEIRSDMAMYHELNGRKNASLEKRKG